MNDEAYLDIILKRIRVCKSYRPKFGQGAGEGLTLEQFQDLYGSDVFYAWFGLDHPLMYAAHKAAGGITSVYRQIGTGCEELFRQILKDQFILDNSQVSWSYDIPRPDGSSRRLALDGRLTFADIENPSKSGLLKNWMREASAHLGIEPAIVEALRGVVFEVRQGYKSKDSKRQNADIANAAAAYTQGYFPVALILSTQIDNDLVYRYQSQRWQILRGYSSGTAIHSTYTFMREVIGFDLAAFLQHNSSLLTTEIIEVLESLLSADE
ncbi:MAG: hypothetical protein K8L91_20055 [Anaerolineae bacterium]|nr:hypothetical protein [Anaerolineae bacterium]